MHAINGAEPSLTRRVVAAWDEHAANGWSGRRLPSLVAGAGLTDPVVTAATIVATDARLPGLEPFTSMAAAAARHGAVTAAGAATWLQQLRDASARGSFFWAVTMFLVAATRDRA
jgi:hypothetical protein